MDNVSIIFSRRRAIGSILLRAWMHSSYSHCGIIDPSSNTVIEAAFPGGVVERSLEDFCSDKSKWEIITIPVPDAGMVIHKARTQLGKPYDWKGILGFWFRRSWHDNDAFLCSELIAWAFDYAGFPLFRRKANRISPEHLYLPIFR